MAEVIAGVRDFASTAGTVGESRWALTARPVKEVQDGVVGGAVVHGPDTESGRYGATFRLKDIYEDGGIDWDAAVGEKVHHTAGERATHAVRDEAHRLPNCRMC